MSRAGTSLDAVRVSDFNGTALYQLNPSAPAFTGGGWPDALDDLRIRRRKRNERLKDWRATAPLRAISFRPATTKEGADAEGVLQVHLEHRLVRRLLSRFLNQRLASGLGGTAATWPLAARAQQPAGRVYRVGYLSLGSREQQTQIQLTKAFEEGLRSLGYRVGENVVIEYRFASLSEQGGTPVNEQPRPQNSKPQHRFNACVASTG
jgi:hypothetical protein